MILLWLYDAKNIGDKILPGRDWHQFHNIYIISTQCPSIQMNMYLPKIHEISFLISHETWHKTWPMEMSKNSTCANVIC